MHFPGAGRGANPSSLSKPSFLHYKAWLVACILLIGPPNVKNRFLDARLISASCMLLIAVPGQACWKLWANSSPRPGLLETVESAVPVESCSIGAKGGNGVCTRDRTRRIANIPNFSIDTGGDKGTNLPMIASFNSDIRPSPLSLAAGHLLHLSFGSLCQAMAQTLLRLWILSLVCHGGGKPPSPPLFYGPG
jgi:hypothetical protein